jgi:hypothetical protein
MELSSMLAGEPFSDRPKCVDPTLAAYLRAFNDRLGHHDRQRLYPYAALAVGTRGGRAATRARRDRCLHFAGARRGPLARARLALRVGLRAAVRLTPGAGEWAAREVFVRGDIDAGFALLDALVGVGPARWPNRSEPSSSSTCSRDTSTPTPMSSAAT